MGRKYNLLLLSLLILTKMEVFGQEQFQPTQFINSAHAINPAFTGVEDDLSVIAGFRRQWSAIENAPLSYFAGFSGSLSAMKVTFSDKRNLRLSVPRYYNKLQNQVGAYSHGVGIFLSGDHSGPFHQYASYFNYSFIYNISENYTVATGASVSLNFQHFSNKNIALYSADQDRVYQDYLNDERNQTEANVNLGVALIGNNLFAGYSLHQLVSIRSNTTADTYPGRYHYLMGGYNFLLNEQFTLQPSVFLRYNENSSYSASLLTRLKYRELCWGGVGYRHDEAIAVLVGFMAENGLHFGYSYDIQLNEIGSYTNGSHEFTLGFSIYNDRVSREFLW